MVLTIKYHRALLFARLFLWLLFFLFFIGCKKQKHVNVSWTKIESGTASDLKSIYFFPSSDTIFVCGGKREANGIVLRSLDAGVTWQTVFESKFGSFNKLYFKNTKEGFVLSDFLDIYKTTDGGANWEHCAFTDTVNYNYKVVLRDLQFINDTLAFALGGDDFGNGIILKTTDNGAHWHTAITEDHELRAIHFTGATTGFASGYGILLKTTDGGTNWAPTSLSDDFFTGINFTDNTTAYLCGYNGNLYKSIDAGNNWNKFLKGNSLISTRRNHFNCIDFADSETGIAAGEQGYALLTQDAGSTWKIATNESEASIQEIKFYTLSSGWAVGDGGAIYKFELK